MINNKLRHMPTKQPYVLENSYEFEEKEWTKEHVVGRKFVPKGKFNGEWNLIVRACEKCNGYKSDLENDISAITMQPDSAGNYAINDRDLIRESKRKSKRSISRRTKKAVHASSEKLNINVPFSHGVNMNFEMFAPPQMDSERMFELARLQLMGFFYMLTYNKNKKRGYYWVGEYFPMLEAIRDDWGNAIHKWFMNYVEDWEPRLMLVGADGFFKAAIRRSPTAELWSWALEWNHNYRLVGFFGDSEATQLITKKIPSLDIKRVANLHDGHINMRTHVSLCDKEDIMFEWQENNA